MNRDVVAGAVPTAIDLPGRLRLAVWSDRLAVWSLIGLAAVMPFAHTGRIQSALLAAAIAGWLGRWSCDPGFRWTRTPVDLPMALLVAWGIVALVTAVDAAYSAREIKNELVTQAVLFVLGVSVAHRARDVAALAWAVAVAGLVMGGYAVWQFDWRLDTVLDTVLTRAVRTVSFTSDSIFLSSYLVLAIPVVFFLALEVRHRAARFAAWSIWFVLILALVSTVTRAAWGAVLVQLLIYGAVLNRRVLVGWCLLAAAVVVAFLAVPSFQQTIVGSGWFQDSGRLVYWSHIIPHVADRPLTGFGYGQETPDRAFPGIRQATPAIDSTHAFNSFIEIMLELGLVGLGVFCWVLWRVGATVWRTIRTGGRDSADRTLLVCILMILVGFIIRNQVDHLFRDAPGHLFWILMGLGVGRAVARPSDSAS